MNNSVKEIQMTARGIRNKTKSEWNTYIEDAN